jgi:hypothetical protein
VCQLPALGYTISQWKGSTREVAVRKGGAWSAFFYAHLNGERMGLHLCYRLTLPGETGVDDVRAKVHALEQFAATVGFEKILGPTEYTIDELMKLDDRDFVKIIASTLCGDLPDFYGIPSTESCAFAFVVVPGAECEPAFFGFVGPGSRSRIGGPDDDLHPGEWFWSAACKTQYASMVSDEHLVKCHLGLVRVLEHAATLGITVTVEDETGFWEHRSVERLIEAVRDMNRVIARFAGAIHDRMGDEHHIDAPIFDHPELEHLEMEDVDSLGQADGADPETIS